MLKYYLVFLLTGIQIVASAQENYFTRNGIIFINSNDSGEVVKIHSEHIQIHINLTNPEFQMTIPVASLHSGIDTLDRQFRRATYDFIQIEGLLNLNEIKIEPHDPYHARFEARLLYEGLSMDINGYGHLEHIPGNDQPGCRLGLNFVVNDFELVPGYTTDFSFQVIQSLLYQVDNK